MRHRRRWAAPTWTTTACTLALTGTLAGTALAGTVLAGASTASAAAAAGTAAVTPAVRVDQAGYATSAAKVAYVMLPHRVSRVWFRVLGKGRGVVYKASSTADLGGWNKRYGAVYRLTFTGLRQSGTYRIQVGAARSAAFRIGPAVSLYAGLVSNGVRYFTSERDGPDVAPSVLDRRPANLTDAHAYVYADPKYDSNDNLIGGFTKTGGPVDVSGGWFDAGGGYEKFGFTASYADALLLIAGRDAAGPDGAGPDGAGLRSEAEFGLDWMRKLWNPAKKVMYVEVGIGNGNAKINGDYDFWFLPQAEDRLGAKPGDKDYYVEYRPVFTAAAPGKKVSPELAGRYAADYALGAQLAGSASSGRSLLALARSVYAMAQTTGVHSLVTAFPHDYYPGTEWKSAMLWGAAEIALADERLGVPHAQLSRDLAVAAKWARAYLAQGHPAGGDTLNLYDNGAVAEAELLRALRCAVAAGLGGAPAIAPRLLLGDLAAQLRLGESEAAGDPFGLGTPLGASDAAPHAFGLYVTNALYQEYGGSAAYAAFAQRQLDYALGANPWGASFVVGAGSSFPYCMQSEIANLSGSLTGSGALQLGATVDGPSDPANFIGLGSVTGMRACSHGSYGAFNSATAGYEDNVVSWPSVEPADDYTAISLFAFAAGASGA
ncbi:MAG TPA: glycoside hydrolase family 9 protein [Trebonia sp.]|nr:glycoside hydrolase family 9 protein [Trebonia sp.]